MPSRSSLRRFSEALAAYQRALELQPNYADALRNIAQALVEGGAPEEAVRALEHARKLEPDNSDTLIALGPLYSSSVARWKRYESHLEPLIDALGPWGPDDDFTRGASPV